MSDADFLPVYKRWLAEINEEYSGIYTFRIWLFTLTENQLNEIKRKCGNGSSLLFRIDSARDHVGYTLNSICDDILSAKLDATLLEDRDMAAPIMRPDYIRLLMMAQRDPNTWNNAPSELLQLAVEYYNNLNSDGLPFYSQKVADLCRNIIAERALLGQ